MALASFFKTVVTFQIPIFRFASPVGEVPRRGGGVLKDSHEYCFFNPSVTACAVPPPLQGRQSGKLEFDK